MCRTFLQHILKPQFNIVLNCHDWTKNNVRKHAPFKREWVNVSNNVCKLHCTRVATYCNSQDTCLFKRSNHLARLFEILLEELFIRSTSFDISEDINIFL